MDTEGGADSSVKKDNCGENESGTITAELEDEEEEEEEDIDLLEKELLEREEKEGEQGDDEDEGEISGAQDGDDGQKVRHRRNIRRMMQDEDLAEETRLEQERERERIQWLKDLHEKSVAEEKARREKKKQLIEERKKQKSGETNQVILLDDSGEESAVETTMKSTPTVITLSSDESEEEDSPLTGYDNTTGFVGGMHTDDTKNVCDKDGRVLVNVNHPPDELDIFLTDLLARTVKNHQIGGIRFLYDNIIESLSRFSYSSGFGCILAHTMGLGKTLQTISFVDCCLRNTPTNTVLIVVPVNVLQNWVNEFDMWVPGPDSQRVGVESRRIYPVYVINDLQKTFDARATIIKKWHENGGVLILGYEMFRLLALTEPSYAVSKKLCKRRRKRGNIKEIVDLDEEEFYMDLLKATQTALLNPGPDIVVCDEGHRIKNAHATISKALKKIKTRRRIVLTGYPLQNNLEEYWCMIDFVRPNFLGTKNEFNNMFVRPIENGQCVDSTPKDTQLMKFRSHVLHSLLEGFVQRRDQSILQRTLQSKTEYVLCVKMSPLQKRLLKRFTLEMEYEGGVNPIYAFTVLTKIWNHPDVLQEVVSSSKLDDLDVDLPKASTKLSLEWAKEELQGAQKGVLEDGTKMLLLLNLIEEGVSVGDKVVVFSQSLLTLSLVEKFLQQRVVPPHPGLTTDNRKDLRGFFKNIPPQSNVEEAMPGSPEYPPDIYKPSEPQVKWTKNKHYFRLDGSTNSQDREKLINQFNKKSESALVFLISTRAGSLGVNLIGSNRVIIMDVSWNPCHDAQAVCRIYRYGQTKPSYVYRFVAESTLERTIYNKQITKQGLSSRVIDEANPEKQFTSSEIVSSSDNFHHPQDKDYNWQEAANLITDPVLKTVMERYGSMLTSAPFTHESLLIENKDDRLTQAEKVMAKKSYQYEKQMNKTFGNYTSNYSKPVNRVSPMCNNQLISSKQYSTPPRAEQFPSQWEGQKTSPLTDLPEKFNMMQNWNNMMKPLSPIAPTTEEQRPVQAIQQQQQQQTFVFANRTPTQYSNNKHRSILPAPSSASQPYIIRPLGQQQPSKLPIPRVPPAAQTIYPHHDKNVPIRSKKTSKVVPSIRPVIKGLNTGIIQDIPQSTQSGIYQTPLNENEHVIQSHDNQPENIDTGQSSAQQVQQAQQNNSKSKQAVGDHVKPGSITDALRKIDERIVEPPTVVAQRMIEQNRTLRRQAELHDIEEHVIVKRDNTQTNICNNNVQNTNDMQDNDQTNNMVSEPLSNKEVENTPDSNIDVDTKTATTEQPEPLEDSTTTDENTSASDIPSLENQTEEMPETESNESVIDNQEEQQQPIMTTNQMVYQAHPISAPNMSSGQGYQLLIQVPGNVNVQPQLIQGQQILQGQQIVGNRPVFIQKQPNPVIQMAQAGGSTGKTVYLMSQPSSMSVNQPGSLYTTSPSFNHYTYLAPHDSIIRLNRPSNENSEVRCDGDEARTNQHGLQQTPAPTSLQQISYEEAAKNQYAVEMQQYNQQYQYQRLMDHQGTLQQQQQQQQLEQYYQMNAAQAKAKPKAKARAPSKAKPKPKPKDISPSEDNQHQMYHPQQIQQQRQFYFQQMQQYNNSRMMRQAPQYQYSNRIDPSQQHPPVQPQQTQQQPPHIMNASIPSQQPTRAQLMQQMQANIKANSARNMRKLSGEDARTPVPHQDIPTASASAQPHYNNQNMYSTFSYGPHSAEQLKQQQQTKPEEVKTPQFSVQQAKQKLQGSDQPSMQYSRYDQPNVSGQYSHVSTPDKSKKKAPAKKKEDKKAPARKRATKRKVDQSSAVSDSRSLHIHAPITFPLEKRTKKVQQQRKPSTEKSTLCPYDQQVQAGQQSPVYNATAPRQSTTMYPAMPPLHQYNDMQQLQQNMKSTHQQSMAPNQDHTIQQQQQQQQQQRMQQFNQWSYQQQNLYNQQSQYSTGQMYQQPFTTQQEFQRSYSPPSSEDIDVNQFLNIPIKNKEGDTP